MASIRYNEPLTITAGDTVKWLKSLGDYPAGTWALTYNLRGASDINIATTASGSDHLVNVDESVTTNYTAGTYYVSGRVTDGNDTYTVIKGLLLTVEPSLASITGAYDGRTHARKMLDAIKAILEGRASDLQDIESYTIGTRTINRISNQELIELQAHYQAIVNAEEDAVTGRNRRLIYSRFRRP